MEFRSGDTGSILKYCTIRYGGESSGDANIYIRLAPNVTISNCEITDSQGSGVEVYGDESIVNFENNVITRNNEYGIDLYPDQVRGIAADNRVSGNSKGGVKIASNNYVKNDATWHKLDAPYVIEYIYVGSENDAILTIETGTEIRFIEGGYIEVGRGAGRILANGALFTSNQDQKTSEGGMWHNIIFYGGDSGSVLENCTIEYGGGNDDSVNEHKQSNILVYDGRVTIRNCIIRNSQNFGIAISQSQSAVVDITGTGFSGNQCDIYRAFKYSEKIDGQLHCYWMEYTGVPAAPWLECKQDSPCD